MNQKTKKKKNSPQKLVVTTGLMNIPPIPKGEIFAFDEDIVPISGMFGRGVEAKWPKEYALIQNMKVNQSAVFHSDKVKMVVGIRTRLSKVLPRQKYVVKKIDSAYHRIWRVEDGAVISTGGGWGGKRTSKKKRSPESIAKAIATRRARGWGNKSRGPKLTHKDGTPIVPELNNVTT